MKIDNLNGNSISPGDPSSLRRRKLEALFAEDPNPENDDYGCAENDSGHHCRSSRRVSDVSPSATPPPCHPTPTFYSNPNSTASSPYNYLLSPWSQPSPYTKSPWLHLPAATPSSDDEGAGKYALIGSLLREEGHVYSLAAAGDLLYTGSDSKNVRVWKNLQEFSGFKSSSGLLKAIVLYGDKIFTGHQDGKIRIWKYSGKRHRRIGSLPTTRDLLVKSINPKNYVEVRRHRTVPWVKHYDAVSCLAIDKNQGLLYSGSWDKTLKVWRISDSKCLESIPAHEDAVNAVEVAFDGLVFTGSADGTVKAWRRELVGRSTRHLLVETIMNQDHALTSLAACHESRTVYAGSSDGLVNFWQRDRHFMAYGGVLRGHKAAVLCVAAAGKFILSGSADKSICVWRRDTGNAHACVRVLTGHTGPVKCLSVEKDATAGGDEEEDGGRWIAYSGSLDGSVKVWKLTE